jgi:UPF0176 protein
MPLVSSAFESGSEKLVAVAVVSFYQFVDIPEPDDICGRLQKLCEAQSLLGTILVAAEGVNGTLAGASADIQRVLDWLRSNLQLSNPIDSRWTETQEPPFRRMRVRVKNEIVTLGRPDIQPQRRTGKHVSPAEWNSLLSRPDTLVIDTRNHYEIEVGTFPGAVDPQSDSFREFPAFASKLAAADPSRPVAMFCTGGIRCEKASALMQELGFTEVYQLQGGILNYLESVTADENLWQGECFVFDTRVAVDRDLAEGGYVQCHACRRPLSSEDLGSVHYREGVSCPKCIGELDADRVGRLEERRRQLELSRLRAKHKEAG